MRTLGSKNIPKLRFPEFSGEWVEAEFGKLNFINPKTNDLPSSFIYIDLESVAEGCLLKEDLIFLQGAPSRAQRLLKKDDVLFQMVRPYQKNNYYFDKTGNYVASTGYAQIRSKSSSKFTYQYLHFQKFVDKVIKACTGTNYPAINSNDLAKILVSYPKEQKEQQKIATFLSSVDKKIEQLDKKKQLLEKYKKGMMQKLFSQQIRFKDENGDDFPDWEEKKLGSFGFVRTSSVDKLLRNNERPAKLLNYMDVYRLNHITASVSFQNITAPDGQFLTSDLKKGDILFTPSSETPKDIGHSAVVMEDLSDVLFSYHLIRFRPEKDVLLPIFSGYVFKSHSFYLELWKRAQGATRYTLSKSALEESIAKYPKSLDEQTKIANFLSTLDDKINQIQTQLTKAKSFKKGLLQQMFI